MNIPLLTKRELEVLRLLATGASNKTIAARLSISEKTVEGHLSSIYRKLAVGGRVEALIVAMRLGLIDHPGIIWERAA